VNSEEVQEMPQTITPYLLYEDAAAALDWLTRAFGFTEAMRMEDDGRVAHAEMDVGRGAHVHLGAPGGDYRSPKRLGTRTALIYLYVDDLDEHCARAHEAGATIIEEPADQPYGDRRYAAEDLEGQHWYFAAPIGGEAE
jgi:PhnB protein